MKNEIYFKLRSLLCLIGASITIVSASQGENSPPLILAKTIPLPGIIGGFNHHAADGRHHRLYVCATTNKSVEVLDLDSGKIVQRLPGEKPSAVEFAADLNILSVSRGKTVELYDAKSFALLTTLTLPCSVDELHYDAGAKQLLAGCMNAPNEGVAPIDLIRQKVLSVIKTPHPQGFCLEDGGRRVFVCTPQADQVTVIDRAKPESPATTWKLTTALGNYPAAFDPATHRLFVGCRHPAKLVVLDTDTGKAVASVDTGKDTDDLSFDPDRKRIYVACGEGVISVIQQDDDDHYRSIATVTTALGGRNSIFIRETGEFCVTVPQRGTQSAGVLGYQAQPAKL